MALADALKIGGRTITAVQRRGLVAADISMSTSQVSQLTLKFSDVGFSLLASGSFNIGTSIDLVDFPMLVSAIDTEDRGGAPGFTLQCRPRSVRALKDRRGERVLANASASDFVVAECRAVNVPCVVQPCAKRAQVMRDTQDPGQEETDNPPSSWSTFSRLAGEEGFIIFEAAGTIYFGRPTYLLGLTKTNVFMTYGAPSTDPWMAMELPKCHKTLDDVEITVEGQLRGDRQPYVRCGNRLILGGMTSMFNGNYLIKQVDINGMNDEDSVAVSAGTPIDPHPNPPTEAA